MGYNVINSKDQRKLINTDAWQNMIYDELKLIG